MTGAPDVGAMLEGGVVVVAATADAARVPSVARAWGPALTDDGTRLRVYVEATLANVEEGGAIAVTITLPSTYVSVQLKGRIAGVATPTPAEQARAAAHADAFLAETAQLGLPEHVGRAIVGTELLAVDVEVSERYDQTPGPAAGRRL